MTEHLRDYLDPEIDEIAFRILDPEPDRLQRTLVKHGGTILERLGGEKVGTTEEGQVWQFPGVDNNAVAMTIHEPDVVIPAMIRYGDRGIFYGYTGKDQPYWTPNTKLTEIPADVETGYPEADGLVAVIAALHAASYWPRRLKWLTASALVPLRDPVARKRWNPSTTQTKQEIAAHYNIRQELFQGPTSILGKELSQYSSGLLLPGRKFESLEDLQRQKVDSLARKLELDSADTLLEVGGGWGGLAVELATRYPNLQVTSLTVSDEQLARANALAEREGVADRVKFIGTDYRDLEVKQPFDRIVSVEMIEAVDWRDLDTYFDKLVEFVKPDTGVIVIQSINVRPENEPNQHYAKSFIKSAIFPGGVLTSKEVMGRKLEQRGWRTHEETELGPSYALTLREWKRNLHDHKEELTKLWNDEDIPGVEIERFFRGFSAYLAFCQAAFRPQTDLMQDWQLSYRPRSLC